jgi:opacity protein-like surface antigen
MRRFLLFLSITLLLPLSLAAQNRGIPSAIATDDDPRVTVFGGYSYLRNGGNGLNGGEVQGTFNINRHFGITGDFSGSYRTLGSVSLLGVNASASQHLFTFMGGPTVNTNMGRASLFAHALFGGAHSSLGAGVSIPIIGGISTNVSNANAFAMDFGGGVDLALTRHVSIRAVQVDYLRTQFSATDALMTGLATNLGNHQDTWRYSTGIVFNF